MNLKKNLPIFEERDMHFLRAFYLHRKGDIHSCARRSGTTTLNFRARLRECIAEIVEVYEPQCRYEWRKLPLQGRGVTDLVQRYLNDLLKKWMDDPAF